MKNQTEWIIRGVFIVVGLGVIAYSFFGARVPVTPSKPEQPPLGKVMLPAGQVVYKAELPGGGGSTNGNVGGGAAGNGGIVPAGARGGPGTGAINPNVLGGGSGAPAGAEAPAVNKNRPGAAGAGK
ncbi:MAG: hypothetical protein K8R88_04555 [Armatimonadetes bacterium]|nr:hypothetical protein [Armatimonadota bacterium]